MVKTLNFLKREGSLPDCLKKFLCVFPRSSFAFTLAEVLITLSIIGVICALTVPNLYRKHQEQVTVAKVKKFYATLDMAYNAAIARTGGAKYWNINNWTAEDANKLYELIFEPYFKVAKICGTSNEGNCVINDNYKLINGLQHGSYGKMDLYYKLILDDGASVWFRGGIQNTTSYMGVYYDVNGLKGPNQSGVDLFDFQGYNTRIEPNGLHGGFDISCKNPTSTSAGFTCTAWVIYKGNMEYLKCDDLKWDGKQKCGK